MLLTEMFVFGVLSREILFFLNLFSCLNFSRLRWTSRFGLLLNKMYALYQIVSGVFNYF